VAFSLLFLGTLVGCRSNPAEKAATDTKVRRYADAGRIAFSEGDDAEALQRYRLAVKRAWSLDEPIDVGRSAYNLAACLASVGHWAEARDWLAEARADLWRGGESLREAWLLEAKIARQQGLLDEAAAIAEVLLDKHPGPSIRRVCHHDGPAETPPGLPPPPSHLCCARFDSQCLAREKAQRLANRCREKQRYTKSKENHSTDVQVHLLRANLACDSGDLETAQAELALARALLCATTNPSVRAEACRASARIWLLAGEPLEAGIDFDREAELMRLSKHYREIPYALYDAAEAYAAAEQAPEAADRYLRTARTMYARDAYYDALIIIDEGLPWVEMSANPDLEGRMAILFREVAVAVERAAEKDRRRNRANTAAETVPAGTPLIEEAAPTVPGPVERLPELIEGPELPEARRRPFGPKPSAAPADSPHHSDQTPTPLHASIRQLLSRTKAAATASAPQQTLPR
jgi:tetratricopeptide (TPR) repeat protein